MDKNLTPYAVETAMACLERTIKRLWILCILLVVFLVGTNAAWIYYESQFEVVETLSQEVTQEIDGDGDGSNVFIGGDSYGETQADGQNNKD